MNSFALKISLGITSPSNISSEEISFYKWLVADVVDRDFDAVTVSCNKSIPLPADEILEGGYRIYGDILKEFDRNFEPDKYESVLIDIDVRNKAYLRGNVLKNILDAVEISLARIENKPQTVVFLCERLIPVAANVYKEYLSISQYCKTIQIDGYGRTDKGKNFEKYQFRRKLLDAKRSNPRFAIEQKMVKQIGHFKKDNPQDINKKICTRHFYDGQYCIEEIKEYLKLELNEEIILNGQICYHSYRSPWLVKSMISLGLELNCEVIDVKKDLTSLNLSKKIFLILDFLDSGETLFDVIRDIGKIPERIISIVATVKQGDEDNKITLSRQNGNDLNIEYILGGEYKRIGPEEDCYLCKLHIPEDKLPKLQMSGNIRSIDFWELASHAEIDEKNEQKESKKKHRIIIKNNLDIDRLLHDNGSYLAAKIKQVYADMKLSSETSIVFIEDDEISNFYLNSLYYLVTENNISIPRDVVVEAYNHTLNLDKYIHTDWYGKVNNRTFKRCVVIDDVMRSGKTLKGFELLFEKIGKEIYCLIPIINLNPNIKHEFKSRIVSMYEWQEELN